MEGTNKARENGEAMGFVGVRLTAQLGRAGNCAPLLVDKSLVIGIHQILEKLDGLLQLLSLN